MTPLILIFLFVILLIAYAVARIAAWLYFIKHISIALVCACTSLVVFGVYVLTFHSHFGTVFRLLPFVIGVYAGNAAYHIALVCQGLFIWILSLLFFWGIYRLKKYDEEYEKKHKNNI